MLLLWCCALLALGTRHTVASEPSLRYEAQLIWGTNDRNSPDPKQQPVDADVKAHLQKLPLKWNNYFEVNRHRFQIPSKDSTNVVVSEKCSISVKRVVDSTVEVSFIGKGNPVEKRIMTLSRGEMLVYGGNAPNSTVWLVILKRVE
jgi:hypothetical protein